jgi:UDP-N-acetylglucosamine pyrophosphorylase
MKSGGVPKERESQRERGGLLNEKDNQQRVLRYNIISGENKKELGALGTKGQKISINI